MTDAPILVFDSGVGGLTVLREARVLMPDRRFVYVADDAGFPYGNFEEEALKDRLVTLFGGLIETHQPLVCVIACNTASTLALDVLRQNYPDMRFVGTVPAIKPAAERTRSGLVSVLATPGTVKRQYTQDLVRAWASKCEVTLHGSVALAGLAEKYMRGGFIDESAVLAEIQPCFVEKGDRRTDIVVLACTHYPFLANRMRKTAPWPVDWLDPAEAIARQVARVVADNGTRSISGDFDPAVFTSGVPDFATRRIVHGFGLRTQ